MSQKANPTFVGSFIVLGLLLGIVGAFYFSSVELFTRKREAIIYIDESLNGLDKGAPVKFQGVRIGSVKRVMVRLNQADNDYSMPVVITVEEKLLQEHMGEAITIFDEEALAERIRTGLRASLQVESLVTGILYIEMRINPNAAPPIFHQLERRYVEIPTEPTEIQKLFHNLARFDIKRLETNVNNLLERTEKTLASVNFEDIGKSTASILRSIDRIVSSPDVDKDLATLRAAIEQVRALAESLNAEVKPVSESIKSALGGVSKDVERLSTDVSSAIVSANKSIDKVAADFSQTLTKADKVLDQIRAAAENMRTTLAPDSALRTELDRALQQIADASQSIGALVDLLRLYPNSLLVGREFPQKNK